jgi:beta-galactosidase/beta-glucuronidase
LQKEDSQNSRNDKKMMKLLGVFFLIATVVSDVLGSQCPSWEVAIEQQIKFELTSCSKKIGPVQGNVPGSVHTDLMKAGIVHIDPYFRYEEKNLSWIPQECWEYKSSPFDLSRLSADCELNLRFDSLDAVATVTLNDVVVGNSVNAHRMHDLRVPSNAMKASNNVLKVTFHPALQYNKDQAANYPYEVPATQNWNVWAEPSSRPFLRKAGR